MLFFIPNMYYILDLLVFYTMSLIIQSYHRGKGYSKVICFKVLNSSSKSKARWDTIERPMLWTQILKNWQEEVP